MMKDGIRQEETPAHDAVREALINCIVHQDINAQGHIIVERTDDSLAFHEPGHNAGFQTAILRRRAQHLPQSYITEDVHDAWPCRESRQRSG